ncbi:MFS transporter [Paraburkholderia sp. BCC1886]|uniref:MFS transporter n=1 Tax=Paraburkholderia sp. BCC1886 TaxID=2562670 RepID=UPI001C9011DA|nr:MFS transporter [Paraburkholderia sp. BCC1886]
METNTLSGSADMTTSTAWRAQAAMLAIGTFAVGTDAFVIAGVLPSIASSMRIDLPAAGQMVTVFSLAYALSAPITGALSAGWFRRTALTTGLLVLVLGNILTALAPTFGLALASRVVAAIGAGLYTGTASATAAALAGPARRGRAIAIVMLGMTSSLVLGAPLGTAIGTIWNWRVTLFAVAALALAAGAVIYLRIPAIRETTGASLGTRLAPLRSRWVVSILVRALLVFIGIFLPYTYISAIYAPVTAANPGALSWLLLIFGVASTLSNLTAGRLTDHWGPRRVIVVGSLGIAAALALMPWMNASLPLALLASFIAGLFSFSQTTPQQHLILSHAPAGTQSVVIALYQAVLYLGVSLSGAIGAGFIKHFGAHYLSWLAVLFVAVSLLPMLFIKGREPIH